jgi:hypothetical protein
MNLICYYQFGYDLLIIQVQPTASCCPTLFQSVNL